MYTTTFSLYIKGEHGIKVYGDLVDLPPDFTLEYAFAFLHCRLVRDGENPGCEFIVDPQCITDSDVAIKMNLLLHRILNEQIDM